MKIVLMSHTLKFTPTDNNYNPIKCSYITKIQGKEEIPGLVWQLSYGCASIRKEQWRLSVMLRNYKEFKIPGIITAVGKAHLKYDFGDAGDRFGSQFKGLKMNAVVSECPYGFDLCEKVLNSLTEETVWSWDCHNCIRERKYVFDVNITLIFKDPSPNLSKIQSDFTNLLQNGEHSDLVLVAEDREFPVHKNILSSRSPVFQAMLATEMREKRENKVEIPDVKSDVMEKMLIFMYSGSLGDCENDAEFLEELFMAADKYGITDLKTEVGDKLCDGISAENVTKRLVLAERFEEMNIKRKCLEFIRDNCDALSVPPSAKN